jgi:hypothetical protein
LIFIEFFFVLFFDLNSERAEVIYPAIDALYRKHHEHKLHRFTEEHREKHIANWK